MHACKEEQGREMDRRGKLADREKIIPNDDPVSHKARAGERCFCRRRRAMMRMICSCPVSPPAPAKGRGEASAGRFGEDCSSSSSSS